MQNIVLYDYLTLCKPKVVLLMLLTCWVGMYLAANQVFHWQPWMWGTIGIAFCASSAAIINHLVDRKIDALMLRTAMRPMACGRITPKKAIYFSSLLGTLGLVILYYGVNPITTVLTALTLFGYAIFYTVFLKRATPQNIVIGGAAGATPPLLGWTAVTDTIHTNGLLLALIIFTWTPPHFWALAIYRAEDYAKANIPMLPVTHGIDFTKLCILLYTILLWPICLLPFLTGMCGLLYVVASVILNSYFLGYAIVLYRSNDTRIAFKTFRYSIIFLMLLFCSMLLDHHWRIL